MAEDRAKLLRKRLLLALAGVGLTLLLLELVLRLALGNLDVAPFVLEPGDGRCVGLEPGASSSYTGTLLRIPSVEHAINEQGFRGPERPEQPEPGTLRIVALGDSFTFGQGVRAEQALPAALEAELREAGAPPLELLNFGVPGLNLAESVDQYRYFARRWQAQVVIMFLFENDLDGPLCDIVGRRLFLGLVRRSRLFRVGVIALAPEALGAPNPRPGDARAQQLREQLGLLRGEVEAEGARLLLVALADPLADAARTRELSAELGIPALVFERETYEALEILPNETHWTAEANREAAAQIAGWLAPQLAQAAP